MTTFKCPPSCGYDDGESDISEWISVKDEIPPPMKEVLCYDTQRIYIAYRDEENEYNEHWIICEECCSCTGCTGAITHWMPLLPSPEE